jgi:general secretion pathway protein G
MVKQSFTLIELIVVIAIIAILAAMVAPNAFRAIEKSKITQFIADYKAVKGGLLNCYADTGKWPWINDDPMERFLLTNYYNLSGWDGPYVEKLPRPPWNPTVWISNNWLRWRGSGAMGYFCYENGVTPPIPLSSIEDIDEVLDGGDGPSRGYIRGRSSGSSFNTVCTWLVAREDIN